MSIVGLVGGLTSFIQHLNSAKDLYTTLTTLGNTYSLVSNTIVHTVRSISFFINIYHQLVYPIFSFLPFHVDPLFIDALTVASSSFSVGIVYDLLFPSEHDAQIRILQTMQRSHARKTMQKLNDEGYPARLSHRLERLISHPSWRSQIYLTMRMFQFLIWRRINPEAKIDVATSPDFVLEYLAMSIIGMASLSATNMYGVKTRFLWGIDALICICLSLIVLTTLFEIDFVYSNFNFVMPSPGVPV